MTLVSGSLVYCRCIDPASLQMIMMIAPLSYPMAMRRVTDGRRVLAPTRFAAERLRPGARFLDRLVDQIALPVRWDLVMDTLAAIDATEAIETCPSGTLSGILRRNLKSVTTQTVDTPADAQALFTTDLRTNELMGAQK
jgi:malonyl CoA-acyl carrier protein transacylase